MGALEDPTVLARLEPVEYYKRWMETYFPVRPDQRRTDECRPVQLSTGMIGTAESSSMVRVGATMVVVGIKAEVGEPSLDAPSKGLLIPNVTLAAGCAPNVRAGPPSDAAQHYSHLLLQFLECTRLVSPESLTIIEGHLVWCLYIDAIVLNDAGSIMDAVWMAVTSALRKLRLPPVHLDEESGLALASYSATANALSLPPSMPIPISFVFFPERQV